MPVVEEERGFTEYHTLLLTTHRLGDAQELADRLEECHIIAGACEMPEELGGGGLRLGVQELTRKGLEEKDAPEIAECIAGALRGQDLPGVKSRVQALARKFSQVRFTIH